MKTLKLKIGTMYVKQKPEASEVPEMTVKEMRQYLKTLKPKEK